MSKLFTKLFVIVTILCALCGYTIALAQHSDHKHDEESPAYRNFKAPQVTYQVHGEVLPREGLINGRMDLTYQNSSSDTLTQISLDLGFSPWPESTEFDFHDPYYRDSLRLKLTEGRSTYCWIDSILFQAARLKAPCVVTDSHALRIELPKPIKPGEIIPLMISFQTRFAESVDSNDRTMWELIPSWFPQVVGHNKEGSVSEYRISLTINSAFSLIGGGELFNEKEHYGTFEQSDTDTVFTDVTAHPFAFRKDHPYVPNFNNGIKPYHFRLLNGHDFPLVVTDKFLLDRTILGGIPIEVYYRDADLDRWQRRVAEMAREVFLVHAVAGLGHYPYPKFLIVSADDGSSFDGVREIIALRSDFETDVELYNALAKQLRYSWTANQFPSVESDSLEKSSN